MTAIDAALETAAAHAKAGAVPAALAVLLAAWRELPAPALADAIDAVDARSPGTPPTEKDWAAIAKKRRPEDLARLLRTWRDVPGAGVATRAKLLNTWPADPRRDAVVARLLHEAPYRQTTPFWTQLFLLAAAIRDVRQLDLLRTVAGSDSARWRAERVAAVVDPVIAMLAATAIPPLGERGVAAQAALAQLPDPTGDRNRASRAGELRDRVFERPDDYALRAIYADALIEAGDPLGELIALALQARGGKPSKQQLALTKSLTKQILGPLDKVVYRSDLEIDCGFVSRCAVNTESPQLVAEAVGSPWWSTVVDLTGPAEVFLDPVMRSLRRLRVIDSHQTQTNLEALIAAPNPPPLDTLGCVVRPAALELLGRARLPTLRHLRAESCNAEPAALLELPLIAQLESLRIDLPWMWRPWVDAVLARGIQARLVVRQDYEHIELHVAPAEVDIRFVVPPAHPERRAYAAIAIARALDRSRIPRVTITPSRRIAGELRRQLDDAVATK